MKNLAFIGFVIMVFFPKESFGMDSPGTNKPSEAMESPAILRKKEVVSESRKFIDTIERLKSVKETDELPLSPNSVGETNHKYPHHKVLRVDEKDGIVDFLLSIVRTSELIVSQMNNSMKVVSIKGATCITIPKEKHTCVVGALIPHEKAVLDRNNIDPLTPRYMQLYEKSIENSSIALRSLTQNQEFKTQIEQQNQEKKELQANHQKCLESEKKLRDGLKKVQDQLAHEKKMGERLFTKKTVIAAGIGAIVSACGCAAYLKWWHRK